MNQEYLDIVGTDMINSFLQYTPSDFELRIYAENIIGTILLNDRIVYYDWNVSCKTQWQEYKSKTDDAKNIKFAKKGFAFLHAMTTINTRYIVWIDADVHFLKNTDQNFFINTINKNMIGLFDHSYLNISGYSAESGYVILDTTHKDYKKFVDYYKYYYTLPEKPKQIERWYDGQVCMLAASHFKKVYNLSNLAYNKNTHTPMNDSPMNEFLIHHKGKPAKRYIRNSR